MELLGEGRELRRDEKRWSEGEETMELTDVRRKLGSGEDWRRRRGGRAADGGCGVGEGDDGMRGQLGRREVAVGGGKGGGGSGVVVEWWFRWWRREMEWRPGCSTAWRSRWRKRRSAVPAGVVVARGRSSLESSGGGERRGEHERARGELGRMGKREMEVWGSFYSARGVETMAGRGGNSRRGGVATWARGGGKPAPKFGGKWGKGWRRWWGCGSTTWARTGVTE